MIKKLNLIFQISAVFIGTVVGAGLASGQEITNFFTTYGYKSFIGLLFCSLIYIFIGCLIIKISTTFNLNSYNELIKLVSPGYFGKVTDLCTTVFLISSSAIILAGSGALINQFFGFSRWIGILIISLFSILILLRNTKGLIEVNSFIVPSLTIVICTIFLLYIIFSNNTISITSIKGVAYNKNFWFFSAILYGGFNILTCSGVLVPLSKEIKDTFCLNTGLILGVIVLTVLSCMINFMLMVNIPYIFKYEIPLLYIASRFSTLLQAMLMIIIWLEMFSTEIADIYSVSKTLESTFKISYKKSIFIILFIAIPISQIGFSKLIKFLYPAFGAVSIVFMIQCILFYKKRLK